MRLLPLQNPLCSHTADIFSIERKCLKPGGMAFIRVKIMPSNFINDNVLITYCPKLREKLVMDDVSFVDSNWTGSNKIFVKNAAPFAVFIYDGEFLTTAVSITHTQILLQCLSMQ